MKAKYTWGIDDKVLWIMDFGGEGDKSVTNDIRLERHR